MASNLITVRGSYGELTVHRLSGHIVSRDLDGDEYDDIRWFDPARLPEWDCDILATAFAADRGIYVRELPWCPVSQMWEDPLFLPAPTTTEA